ncbi:Tyrosine-protein kinase transforming protein ros [Geodia barretti]|nr:Tyrosine-protein kinase transforming protein ros [Geodia barretti]
MLFQKHHLELSKVVGQGESGLVYRGYINSSGGRELVAVKTGKALASPTDKEKLLKEVCVMLSFSHKNVMSLIGLCLDGEVPLLIMPFMINGTVLNYIKQNRETLYFGRSADKKQVESARIASLGVCHQIANGMSYLTKHKFVHRDLAARNCMIDENGVIKVADFGLTEDMYATNYYRRGGGEGGEGGTGGHEEKVPIRWMAPESIEADFYDEKTDVWSFGVTCWEVMTCGGVPYTGIHIMSLLRELNSGHRLDRPSNAVCSDEIWEMMTSCWSTSPGNRPTFTLLVKEFYQMLDNDTSYLKLNDSFKKSQLNTLV